MESRSWYNSVNDELIKCLKLCVSVDVVLTKDKIIILYLKLRKTVCRA